MMSKNIPATRQQVEKGDFYTEFPNETRRDRRHEKYPNSTKMAKYSSQNGEVLRKNKYVKK